MKNREFASKSIARLVGVPSDVRRVSETENKEMFRIEQIAREFNTNFVEGRVCDVTVTQIQKRE